MDETTFTSEAGTLRLQKQIIRGISGHRESVILEMPRDPELIHRAIEAARAQQSQFLSIEIPPDSPLKELLIKHGFQLESHKIVVPSSDWEAPPSSPYAVRPPEAADHFAVAVLNSTVLSHTLCAGRDYDLSELTYRSFEDIMRQVARQDEGAAGLILTHKKKMAGHLLLEINAEQGYIYDLAVEPDHWGGKATQYLMRAGSRLLFQRGIPLMVGDVSASNLRALMYAQRFLGFKVTQERYGLKL